MSNVVTLDTKTLLPIPPERVLEGALEQTFSRVTVIGVIDESGEEYIASSASDCGAILWDMERARHLFMKNADDE
jgi:hypothetical protein